MTIRARLTWWYAGILLLSFLVLAGVLHYEWLEQQQKLRAGQGAEPVWEEVGEILLYSALPTAVLVLTAGWLLMRKAFAPITTLMHAAERIHAHNLNERLPCTGKRDELDRLTQVFNAMMARLEDSFSRIREFTLHASHELKTPLTIMQGEIETELRESTTERQREFFGNQLNEIHRLAKIVDGLALLAKADAGQLRLGCEIVNLHELVHDIFADAEILAQPNRIKVRLDACDAVSVRGDRHRLRQLLLNLADNAIKYNHPGGQVNIALTRNGTGAELKITNSGPGISPASLPRVFDRFYRGDAAHSSAIEGCGLGLSIAQWITRAHGGEIHLESQLNGLTSAIVNLPCVPQPNRNLVQATAELAPAG